MNMLEIIKPFCSTDEALFVIMTPFTRGGFTWATDGRRLVRVPVIPEAAEEPRAPKCAECFAGYPPVPGHPSPEQLPERIESRKCETCAGSGVTYCHHCENENDCAECGGVGMLTRDRRWMLIDGAPFHVPYVLDVCALPGVLMGVGDLTPDGPERKRYLYFTFDGGGAGVLLAKDGAGGAEMNDAKNEWKPA